MLNIGLLLLCNISYETVDKGLILSFVERWHRDINTFHLLDGEMSITSGDVSTLLHISIVGQFCSFVMLDFTSTSMLLIELLEVDFGDATTELM